VSIISLYRPLTDDYRVYHDVRPDLYVEGHDQYAAMGELARLYSIGESNGRSNENHEVQPDSGRVGRDAAVLGLCSRQEWRDRSEMLRQSVIGVAGEGAERPTEIESIAV
jgi:hypothetical protein